MTALRRAWRICKWLLLLLLCAAGALLLINAIDEPLAPEVTALVQDQGPLLTRQQNMYYSTVSFNAAAQDMEEAGWDRVQAINASLRAGKTILEADKETEQPRRTFVGDKTHLPGFGKASGELSDSLEFVRQHGAEADQFLADNRVLLERYAALQRYPHFAVTVPANTFLVGEPQWEYIYLARRLWKLELAGLLAGGRVDEAIDSLQRDTYFWRRVLAERRQTLLGKGIVTFYVADDFHLASQFAHSYTLNTAQLAALHESDAPLTADERSMAGAFEDEFLQEREELSLIDDPAATMKLLGKDYSPSAGERFSTFLQSRFYLRNATLNFAYRKLRQGIEAESHACYGFKEEEPVYPLPMKLSLEMLRNPVGQTFANISGPYLHSYSGRMCDLLAFQRLLALQLLLRERNLPDDQVAAFVRDAGADYADPYTGAPMQWLPQQHSLSFNAVYKRDQEMLPWPI